MYKLSVIIPFYKNIKSNIEQCFVNEFSAMSDDILKNIQLIFIDDCSLIPIGEITKNTNMNFNLYRIDTDIKWNVGGAKNLGAYLSGAEKLLIFDADHNISEKSIKMLIDYRLKPNEHIIFMRGEIGAPGIFCTTRKRFFELNGFDEQFSGHYGSEDKNYTLRHREKDGIFTEIDNAINARQTYHHHNLNRDSARNKKIARNLKHSGLFLNFEWHKVY